MKKTIDGNTAAASIAYKVSEFASIYPITPSSAMAELCDEWSAKDIKNIFGTTMKIVEMQSEAGVAGALHGALVGGALSTTFTASQGLLLMIPNMYKIAGELWPCVFHVTARTIATHALSIFGDQSDVMACRSTGFAMLCSGNTQEVMDFALLAHACTLKSSVPFLHFFDGFRTSHEIQKIDYIEDSIIKQLIASSDIEKFKSRCLTPDSPKQMGTAQNPDVFFQNREANSPFYDQLPQHMSSLMEQFYSLTGRHYHLFDYYGDPQAENIIVIMGSGSETVEETISYLNAKGEKIGLIKVRLYRPFSVNHFIGSLPKSVKKICVLDKCKESGAIGEPLYQDIVTAIAQHNSSIEVIGGRYGLGGKDFTPAMAKAVIDNLQLKKSKLHFTVGIDDDVSMSSLNISDFSLPTKATQIKIFGLGSDGTVTANKDAIKIIGNLTDKFCQGYFEYDSKKSGSLTISHLRISDYPIKAPYLVNQADLIMCNNFGFMSRYDILKGIKKGGTFVLNCPIPIEKLNESIPNNVKQTILDQNLKFYIINAEKIAKEVKLGNKINTIMQSAFFKLSDIVDQKQAILAQKEAAKISYSRKGDDIVQMNYDAIDAGANQLFQVDPSILTTTETFIASNIENAYYNNFIKPINELHGNDLPVSRFNADGSVPTGTSQLEKRNIATSLPKWNPKNCIECGLCSISCPHACIRPVLIPKEKTGSKPDTFETIPVLGKPEFEIRMQVYPQDCTGCGVCARVCPTKEKALVMQEKSTIHQEELENYNYALTLPENEQIFPINTIKGSQLKKPLFEFSGACAGCGETPYIKLLTQLFGEKLIIANATGCSSIYGGSSPTCPYTTNSKGKGPAWANSLFEDNAEFGLGIAMANKIKNKQDCVWIIGGDGWAYDIGYGGLDHVLASGEKVNILVLDTEVYSNTGGQSSKSTPMGAIAKFASNGKRTHKKPLARLAMAYENVYVAQISLGANPTQAIKALEEAQNYPGPSLVIAYCPCINHGIDMSRSSESMKLATSSGYFPIFRFNPMQEDPLSWDSVSNTENYESYLLEQNRYKALLKNKHIDSSKIFDEARQKAQDNIDALKNIK